jgi:signal transduction histidine kinase
MRRRILVVAVTAAVVAIAVFALPLALAAHRLFVSDEQGELERAALRAMVAVDPAFTVGDQLELPPTDNDIQVTVYDRSGRRVTGGGPVTGGAPVAQALHGTVAQAVVDGKLVAALPVSTGEHVIGVVTASSAASAVWVRTLSVWAAMLLVALLALGAAVLLAGRQSARLNRPLVQLAAGAQALGQGDFTARTEPSGVPEIDQTAAALNASAVRLSQLVQREREMSANASHQLRTPLTALRLTLETALDADPDTLRVAAADAIATADHLESTIEELLRLARGTETSGVVEVDPAALLDAALQHWGPLLAGAGRPLRLAVDPLAAPATCSPTAAAQIVDTLVENAVRHGAGAVTITARPAMGALAIDVEDEGVAELSEAIFERGWSDRGGQGIGLALGRDLASNQGGRLLLSPGRPGTVFTLLLPVPPPEPRAR